VAGDAAGGVDGQSAGVDRGVAGVAVDPAQGQRSATGFDDRATAGDDAADRDVVRDVGRVGGLDGRVAVEVHQDRSRPIRRCTDQGGVDIDRVVQRCVGTGDADLRDAAAADVQAAGKKVHHTGGAGRGGWCV